MSHDHDHHDNELDGAKVVARAWSDPSYADWLRRDATEAIGSLGFTGRQGEHMQAVFNTADTHISSSAPCGPAIHGRCSACRRSGTRRRPIAAGR